MRRLFLCLAACVLLAASATAADKKPAEANGPALNSTAQAFSLPDLAGKQVSLEQYRGKVVVLNFWAFWCDTWKAEMPHLKELAGRQVSEGFRLVAVSVDGTRLDQYRQERDGPAPFPVLLDAGSKVTNIYHVHHVPTVVIVDADGRVRYVKVGYPGNAAVLHQVRKLEAERKRE